MGLNYIPGGLGQLIGVARNRTRTQALQHEERKKAATYYVETGINRNLFYLINILKVLQNPLKVRRVGNQNNNYNRLLCFRLGKVSQAILGILFSLYILFSISKLKANVFDQAFLFSFSNLSSFPCATLWAWVKKV